MTGIDGNDETLLTVVRGRSWWEENTVLLNRHVWVGPRSIIYFIPSNSVSWRFKNRYTWSRFIFHIATKGAAVLRALLLRGTFSLDRAKSCTYRRPHEHEINCEVPRTTYTRCMRRVLRGKFTVLFTCCEKLQQCHCYRRSEQMLYFWNPSTRE